jgi:hypothetical protein
MCDKGCLSLDSSICQGSNLLTIKLLPLLPIKCLHKIRNIKEVYNSSFNTSLTGKPFLVTSKQGLHQLLHQNKDLEVKEIGGDYDKERSQGTDDPKRP